jgi:hypothetical protein
VRDARWAVALEDDALKISSRKKFRLVINDLTKNNMIFSKVNGTDGKFVIVPLSGERLEHEILSADRPDPDRFYWFGTR